jgi:hypothetical protein
MLWSQRARDGKRNHDYLSVFSLAYPQQSSSLQNSRELQDSRPSTEFCSSLNLPRIFPPARTTPISLTGSPCLRSTLTSPPPSLGIFNVTSRLFSPLRGNKPRRQRRELRRIEREDENRISFGEAFSMMMARTASGKQQQASTQMERRLHLHVRVFRFRFSDG